MKSVYDQLKRASGTERIETDFEKFLRDQSTARDKYALLRKEHKGSWSSDGPQGVRGVNMRTLQAEPREGSPMTNVQNWERYNTTDFYSKDVNDKFINDAETLKSDLIKGSEDYINLNDKYLNLRDNYKKAEEKNQKIINELTSENSTIANRAQHYEDQYNQANETIEDLNRIISDNNRKIEDMDKINNTHRQTIQDLTDKDTRNKREINELNKSKNHWKLGTGIASALGVAGTGAGIVYGSKKSKENKK